VVITKATFDPVSGQLKKTNNMTEFDKIDRVLKIILNCEKPPRITDVEIDEEIKKQKIIISTKERIEIIDKLIKDGFIIKEIIDELNRFYINYYFSSFEGRLFLLKGGYSSQYLRQKWKHRKDIFMISINVINIILIIILTFYIYRATDKANDNKIESLKLNSKIDILTKSNDSLIKLTK